MEYLCAALGILCLYQLLRLYKLKRFLQLLSIQSRERKSFLYVESGHWARRYSLDSLTRHLNQLVEESAASNRLSASYINQIETTLSNLAEAVFIVNTERQIVLANPAARSLLNLNRNYQGLRLDSVITSTGFLAYMDKISAGKAPDQQTVELIQGKKILYFEVMAAEVDNPQDEQQPLTIFILHDITRMKELERLRKDFVANVSHELRTPVTVIKGFTETLSEDFDKLGRKEQLYFLEKIHRNVGRLHDLLEDLLLLSGLEAGDRYFSPERCALNRVVEEFAESFALRVENEGKQLVTELDPTLPEATLDPLKIHQVLQNLCDNALRYAKGCTRVIIRTRREGLYLSLSVEDDGSGIPERDLPHIFERFYRVDKGRSRELGGTGLGLSIVKHIAQIHGGEVSAFSEKGEGTNITLLLPAKVEEPVLT